MVVRYLTQVGELHADGLFAAGFSGAKVDAHSLQRGPQAEGSRTPAPPLSFQFVPYGNTKMQVGHVLSAVIKLFRPRFTDLSQKSLLKNKDFLLFFKKFIFILLFQKLKFPIFQFLKNCCGARSLDFSQTHTLPRSSDVRVCDDVLCAECDRVPQPGRAAGR